MTAQRNFTTSGRGSTALRRPLLLGAVGLAASVLGSGLLVWQHFAAAALPGCGPGSACAAATSSVWGVLPGIGWPVSFIGLAYFLALLVAWPLAVRDGSPFVRWIVRAGAAVSALYIIVIVFNLDRYLCPYCLLAHAGHITAWLALESAHRRIGREVARVPAPWPPGAVLVAGFIVASGLLAAGELANRRAIEREDERELQASTERAIEQTARGETSTGFTGRYRIGPEKAPLRLVVFTDYQCTDCRSVEEEIEQLVENRDDVSVSFKHFPMNSTCNPHMTRNPHPNACWAARAAEAAGMLRGSEGFWQMHRWLFDRGGSFTDQTLPVGLRSLGYDPEEFISVMRSDETLRRVQADIEEGVALGLHFTPMVFLNGVEVRGWRAREGLTRAVEDVAMRRPRPADPTEDEPVGAYEKYLEDWRDGVRRPISDVPPARTLGRADAPARIDVWGDYHSAATAALDRMIREKVADRDDVLYSFHLFPGHSDCNPHSQVNLNPHACRAAAAGAAASRLFDREAYWALHDWLMRSAASFSDETLRNEAAALGLDAGALLEVMNDPTTMAAVREECEAARLLGVQRLPMIFIDRRWVPRWELEGRDVLDAIIEEGIETATQRARRSLP